MQGHRPVFFLLFASNVINEDCSKGYNDVNKKDKVNHPVYIRQQL